jgi:ABC-2 type transport system ATP-binding protein
MKVVDQLRFFAELKNVTGKELEKRIDFWLQRLKLSEWKKNKAMELSKGMQQKIQFVSGVIHDPDLLILDEPFSGLDPVSVELLKDVVMELKQAGKTIMFSTHQMEVAEKICDDICLINKSEKVLEGSLRQIRQSFGRHAVALRIGDHHDVLKDPGLVSHVTEHSDELEVWLAPGATAQKLLTRLVETGAMVSKFEMIEPSLKDIFISKVGEAG